MAIVLLSIVLIGYGAMLTAVFGTWNSLVNPDPGLDVTDPANLMRRAQILWGNAGSIIAFTAWTV
jgi:hypothetical protein